MSRKRPSSLQALSTLVVSDLHLGASARVDLMRRAELRAPLIAALRDGIDRLVILGDGLELREVPVRRAAEHALPLLREAGEALGAGGEIVMLAGNHDHGLLGGWLGARQQIEPPRPMGLEERIEPDRAGPLAVQLAEAALPATLAFAYPGLRLRDDVYATHGHYLDLHTTVPTLERVAAGAMARFVAPIPERATPDDYEAVLSPLYAWLGAIAQRPDQPVTNAGKDSSQRAYVALAGDGARRRPLRAAALRLAFFAGVSALNTAGIGRVEPRLSGASLRRGSLVGMGEVVRRLGVEADHVIFGHSHRAGPWPVDDPSEWTTPTGVRLHNTGSWSYQPHFHGERANGSPYWPGTAIRVDAGGPPQLVRLLDGVRHTALRPPDLEVSPARPG